jgi:tight adherence protein C
MWTIDAAQRPLVIGLLCFGLGFAALCIPALALMSMRPLQAPTVGERGRRRRMARHGAAAAQWEMPLAIAGAAVKALGLRQARHAAEEKLRMAAYPAGLWPEELLAASIALGLAGGVWALAFIEDPLGWASLSAAVGGALPWLHVAEVVKGRASKLERGLPAAMDLCVLCMGAGADFPAALRFAVDELGHAHPICSEELAIVLEELELGRTRGEALAHLGERTSSPAVRDFVAAVCQSELKGTPVVEALTLQAEALRIKRSVNAEELAAKTAVRLTFPLMMTLVCVLLLLFGPFIVRGGL